MFFRIMICLLLSNVVHKALSLPNNQDIQKEQLYQDYAVEDRHLACRTDNGGISTACRSDGDCSSGRNCKRSVDWNKCSDPTNPDCVPDCCEKPNGNHVDSQESKAYRKADNTHGCCTGILSHQWHQRCHCPGHLSRCKRACDNDNNCKGYVKHSYGYCETATTSNCPWDCKLINKGNVGELVDDATCGINFGGCFIKAEPNSCPVKYWAGTGCPGSGKCCNTGWTRDCNQNCVKKRCEDHLGTWIPRDYSKQPYTCEIKITEDLCSNYKPLSKQEGRCGPSWGGRCNKHLAYWAIYCNESSGWCGTTGAHKDAQSSDKYDWNPSSMPASCNGQ